MRDSSNRRSRCRPQNYGSASVKLECFNNIDHEKDSEDIEECGPAMTQDEGIVDLRGAIALAINRLVVGHVRLVAEKLRKE